MPRREDRWRLLAVERKIPDDMETWLCDRSGSAKTICRSATLPRYSEVQVSGKGRLWLGVKQIYDITIAASLLKFICEFISLRI